jgi:teichuronic acid biosynthesis glycosyltransferase TuaC
MAETLRQPVSGPSMSEGAGLATRSDANESVGPVLLRVLTMTTLYPSAVSPRHGIFVETRLRKLREIAPIDLQVVAPVPWFPVAWKAAGRYATYAATPHDELRDGIHVRHPRYLSLPKVGMALQPASLASASLRAAEELRADGWLCDVIDAHYLYPDGVAAAALAKRLGRPFVVTARGSDVNLIAQMPAPRRRILAALRQAGRVIAVSEALKGELIRIGVPDAQVEVLRNGVDVRLFKETERETTRRRFGAGRVPLIASVGNLLPEKGHDLVLRAAHRVDGAIVVIVGRGPERDRLGVIAKRLGMDGRVHFIENVPQGELAAIYSAADALALGSVREGWPNVVLEAMACGTPVVAVAVGGVGEILVDPVAGELVGTRRESDFADALWRVLRRNTDRTLVRMHASKFSWDPVVRRYYEILVDVSRLKARYSAVRSGAALGGTHFEGVR